MFFGGFKLQPEKITTGKKNRSQKQSTGKLCSTSSRQNLAGTGSILYSGGLFWRQLRFGGNWLHIIFWQIVLEAAPIWRELASHYFPADCFGGSTDLAGTGSTLISGGLFWRRHRFGGNWLHNVVPVPAKIWREPAQ
jgi:hypothetical protein